jgi:hypothetical protein
VDSKDAEIGPEKYAISASRFNGSTVKFDIPNP